MERSENPFAVVIQAHLVALETRSDEPDRAPQKLTVARKSYERGFSKPVVIGLFRFLNRVLWLPDDLETRFDDKMNANEWERKREYVTSIERRGIKKGIAEIVSLQLQRRFGALNEAAQALVSALAVEQVRCERCAI